jgi:SAM-dependent methyltransferase
VEARRWHIYTYKKIKLEYYNFKYTDSLKLDELMFLQIDKDEKTYLERSIDEYLKIGKFIDSEKCKKIVDLGCGLGRSSIFLNNMMSLSKSLFYMCDFNGKEFDKTRPCGEHIGGNIPYNDLQLTKSFSLENNLLNIEIIDLGKEEILKLKDIDLLYSFHCVGYHWDILTSFRENNLEDITSDNSILIFGVRKHYKKLQHYPISMGSFELKAEVDGEYLQNYVVYQKKIN